MNVVVVGGGLGGLRTVEELRQRGYAGDITLVGAEPHEPYDRPPLTKQILRGEAESSTLRAELHTLRVNLILGRAAVDLNAADRQITLDDGTAIHYETIVIATGGRPRLLPDTPMRPGLHVLRTIGDSLELRRSARRSGAVVVIGGGFIGCEIASSLRHLGVEVDLVELLPSPLAHVLGPVGGQLVGHLLREHGVRLHTESSVARVLGDERVEGVELVDGRVLPASEVVLGLGMVPNVEWLSDSEVRVEDGVLCDSSGRTSAAGVLAVGDSARWWQPALGEHRRVEHWTTTVEQAATVASLITEAVDQPLETVPYFWSDQFGIKIQALGFVEAGDDVVSLEVDGRSVLLYSRHGVLRSVVGFRAPRLVMRLRPLIARRAALDEAIALLAP